MITVRKVFRLVKVQAFGDQLFDSPHNRNIVLDRRKVNAINCPRDISPWGKCVSSMSFVPESHFPDLYTLHIIEIMGEDW